MNADDKKSHDGEIQSTKIIFGTLLDTTWRMFIPVALFMAIGWGIDQGLKTTPIAILIGLASGTICAFSLVAFQLKNLTTLSKQEQKK